MEGARCKDTNLLYGATVSEPGKPDATYDKGTEGRSVDFLYTICRYIATIHTDIVYKLTRSVEIVSQKNGHYFLNLHYLYKDRLYLLVRQDLLK